MSDTPAAPWRTWLQLLRAPNLFTVPGDPLAGFLLASGGLVDFHLILAIAASLCFYSHGLLLNDLADLAEDRRDRPTRPLPSGAASPRTVLIVAIALALIALILCWAIGGETIFLGLALLAAIVLYNLWSKKIPILGPINMGLCRGLSIQLGVPAGIHAVARTLASYVPESQSGTTYEFHADATFGVWSALLPLAVLAALGITLYIAAVTHLARIETLPDPPPLPRALPFVALIAVIVPFFLTAIDRTQVLRSSNIWLYLVSAYTLYAGYKIHHRLTSQPPPPIPPTIGQLIRLLLPLQAIFCIASRTLTGGLAATLLLILWPLSRSVSRRFYAS